MISSEDGYFVRIFYFESEEQTDGLDALSSSVNVVSKKEVAWLWRKASVLEQSQHVIELSMDVTADSDGRGYFYHHGLFHEDGADGADQAEYITLRQFDQFSWFGSSCLEEDFDDLVDVDGHFAMHQQIWI